MVVLDGLNKKKTPFYGQVITLSSHPPFTWLPESMRPLRTPGALSGSLIGRYISAESYADQQLGGFFKSLKSTGLWDNSIIVIYGDHTAMDSNTLSGKNATGTRNLLGRNYGPIDRERVGIMIHVPGQTKEVRSDDVAGQVDIMPSLADCVGLDLSAVPHMGRSLFMNSDPLVPETAYYRAGTFLNYRALFMPKSGSSKAAGYRIPDGAGTGMGASDVTDLNRANQLRKISDSWVMSFKQVKYSYKGWIPDPIARRAAKKYGFLQH